MIWWTLLFFALMLVASVYFCSSMDALNWLNNNIKKKEVVTTYRDKKATTTTTTRIIAQLVQEIVKRNREREKMKQCEKKLCERNICWMENRRDLKHITSVIEAFAPTTCNVLVHILWFDYCYYLFCIQ